MSSAGPVDDGGATGGAPCGAAIDSTVTGRVRSTPGKRPSGTPPFTSSLTFFTPGTRFAVSTTWASRAERLSALRPVTNFSPRSTVAMPFATATLRTGTPGGICVRMPAFFSAAVGPASRARTAASASAPSRFTATACSPWRK